MAGSTSPGFSSGVNAIAICQRCGFKRGYLDLIEEKDTGLRVHPHCIDKTVAAYSNFKGPDAIAIRKPTPDRSVCVPGPNYSNNNILWSQVNVLFSAAPTYGTEV